MDRRLHRGSEGRESRPPGPVFIPSTDKQMAAAVRQIVAAETDLGQPEVCAEQAPGGCLSLCLLLQETERKIEQLRARRKEHIRTVLMSQNFLLGAGRAARAGRRLLPLPPTDLSTLNMLQHYARSAPRADSVPTMMHASVSATRLLLWVCLRCCGLLVQLTRTGTPSKASPRSR